jgi:orotidine-5'-phosphate decarboxylase
LTTSEETSFVDVIELSSQTNNKSRIVLALDLDYSEDSRNILLPKAETIIELTAEYVCAIKLNFHLVIPLGINELRTLLGNISKRGLVSIADLKLNDIDNTNLVASKYLWDAGFSAIIVNPFAGYEGGLESVFKSARENRTRGVICLVYMSHKGAEEGYGQKLASGRYMYEELLERSLRWGADGVIVGATRPEIISSVKEKMRSAPRTKIFSPGHGVQGGGGRESLKAGADYLIYGRTIVSSADPRSAVKSILHGLTEG